MDTVIAVMGLEEGQLTQEESNQAMQALIDSGTVWSLQGSYGRSAMDMIKSGQCKLGPDSCRDYWGNRIPSHEEAKDENFVKLRGFYATYNGVEYQSYAKYWTMLDKLERKPKRKARK
jgi:hypothetical protein